MACFMGNIRSKALCMDTQLHVILDDEKFVARKNGSKPKTLILLHGLSDNSATWCRYTSLERYAERYNLTVVMPEAQRSFYTNMAHGLDYEKYIAEELPELCASMFNTSIEPGNIMIAGLSMGGFGSLRTALKYSDRFRICGAFSSATDTSELVNFLGDVNPISGNAAADMKCVYEDTDNLPFDSDMNNLLKEVAGKGTAPRFFVTCGTEDFTYPWNRKLLDTAKSLSIDYHFEEWPGIHEWGFWDVSIDKFLHYFLDEELVNIQAKE